MKRAVTLALLGAAFVATSAFAGDHDPVVGNWKLNMAASHFSGTAPKDITRTYRNSPDGTMLDQTITAADGKESKMHTAVTMDGKDHAITGNPDGKEVGTVHRVLSKDGNTLTVENKGTHPDGKAYDDTLVFDKQK
jgi:membrane protein implicated in regulation of membrane protease activity